MNGLMRWGGVAGLTGAGKSAVALELCRRRKENSLLCGIGAIYLAVVHVAVDLGWDRSAAVPRSLEAVLKNHASLGFFGDRETLCHVALLIDGMRIDDCKIPDRARACHLLARDPSLNAIVLGLLNDELPREDRRFVVIDGRQAPSIAPFSVYLTAPAEVRINRIRLGRDLSAEQARAEIVDADSRDDFMNAPALGAPGVLALDSSILDVSACADEAERHFRWRS